MRILLPAKVYLLRLLVIALAFVLVGWAIGLIVLTVAAVQLSLELIRARRALKQTIACPRGHRVSQYGRFECSACGGAAESWVWRCPVCGAFADWCACPTCGLAVRSPLLTRRSRG